jgi:hypothetical protein
VTIRPSDYERFFEGSVPPNGFQWLDGIQPTKHDPSNRYLQEIPFDQEETPKEDIAEGLFLEFKDLDETEAAINVFSNREGFLGIEIEVFANSGDHRYSGWNGTGPVPEGLPEWASSFDQWIQEIRYMRHACELAGAIKERNAAQLKKWLTIDPGRSVVYLRGVKGEGGTDVYFVAPVKASRWLDAGLLILRTMIIEKLHGPTHLSATIEGFHLKRTIRLHSLLAMMWAQLLESFEDNLIYHCEACGKMNVRKPRNAGMRKPRDDRTLCLDQETGKTSSKCKSRAHRERHSKKKAARKRRI